MLIKKQVIYIQFMLTLDSNDRFPYPFIHLNLSNLYPFTYLKPEKGTDPFRAEPPCVDHYREYPTPHRAGILPHYNIDGFDHFTTTDT